MLGASGEQFATRAGSIQPTTQSLRYSISRRAASFRSSSVARMASTRAAVNQSVLQSARNSARIFKLIQTVGVLGVMAGAAMFFWNAGKTDAQHNASEPESACQLALLAATALTPPSFAHSFIAASIASGPCASPRRTDVYSRRALNTRMFSMRLEAAKAAGPHLTSQRDAWSARSRQSSGGPIRPGAGAAPRAALANRLCRICRVRQLSAAGKSALIDRRHINRRHIAENSDLRLDLTRAIPDLGLRCSPTLLVSPLQPPRYSPCVDLHLNSVNS
jgi:hypothetical protein